MRSELTREEKLLIEREFIARENVRAKRSGVFRVFFWIGFCAVITAHLLTSLTGKNIFSALLLLCYFVSVLLYTELLTIPRTFAQDIDPWWHLNPWREALLRLGQENRQIPAIILLTTPFFSKLLLFLLLQTGR